MRSRWPALNSRVLTAILVVGLPVLAIGTAFVLSIGRSRLKEVQGTRLAQMAEYIAGTVDAYMFRSILDAAVLARVPDIRRAAAAGSERPFEADAVMAIDRRWQSGGTAIAEHALLESAASKFLADLALNDPVKREILVTDRFGRLVAASNMTTDYFQADEDWWREAFDGGRGRASVTDVRRDESAGVYAFDVSVPVPALSGSELAGVMKIVVNSREMLADVAGVNFGASGEAMLVRPNGSIVFRRRPHSEDDRFFASALMREQFESRSRQDDASGPIRFDAGTGDGGTRLVVLAPCQIARTYPAVSWLVALSVDQQELLAPFRSLTWYLMAAFGLTALVVLAIALWLSLRLAAPTLDSAVDMHLVDHAYSGADRADPDEERG